LKILYIIGNGFDLNLGLKSSYKDFYDHYKLIDSPNSDVKNLKRNLSDNDKNWSDLELALGQYTEQLRSLEQFDSVFEDLLENLALYLKTQENSFDTARVNQKQFFENLAKPENFLAAADKTEILDFKTRFANSQWSIDMVTFNYTTVIEKIIGQSKNKIGHHLNGNLDVSLSAVEHIHGYVDNQMVLGVNDLSQLKNNDFHTNQDVLEAIIKEKCNKAHGHTIDSQFKKKIQKADLICLFGSSIGDTDNIWWELIGQRLKTEVRVIIFTKGEEVAQLIGYKKRRIERKMRDYFLKKSQLTPEDQDKFGQKIYVALNSMMFKNMVEKS
jgi:hypothetical protein